MEYMDPRERGRNKAEEGPAAYKLIHPSLIKLYTAAWARLEADSYPESFS